ncbi:hypothetical protein HA402_012556 [Bradysia odoriphaga]|nr:hypothetical protein HA402_012556 [Bradysia odoriphaga]
MSRDYDHLFKLLIIGDSGVGKSSLLIRFSDNTFSGNYITTIGVDFKIRTVLINGQRVKLQIWDTVGNKNDDPNRKVVITEDAQRFAKQMDIQLFETSAKDNINVEEMFLTITEKVLRHKLQQNAQNSEPNDKVTLKKSHGKKKSKCC